MKKSWFKRAVHGSYGFKDFKHHYESWRNCKKRRARHERRKLKEILRDEQNEM